MVALQSAYSGLRFFVPISQKVNYPLILQNYHTMQENTNEELQLRIRDLEKEVARLHAQIKKQRYGLVWLDVPEGFESETENKLSRKALWNAVKSLGEPDSTIIIRQFFYEQTAAEIGKLISMSAAAVQKRSERARKKLRELLNMQYPERRITE